MITFNLPQRFVWVYGLTLKLLVWVGGSATVTVA